MTLAERLSSLTWGGTDYPSYEGRLDRAAAQAAGAAEKTNAANAGTYQNEAQSAQAALTPFYRGEMTAQHGFTPGQTNELLDYAGAGTGGGAATAMGEANSQAARTRNTSGFSSALDQNARQRQQEMATVNAGVGAQDVMGAKELNQAGARGMSGLYGTDVNAMLGSMGQIPQDIEANLDAQKHGWVQDLSNGIAIGQQGFNLYNSIKSGGAMGGSGGGGGPMASV